MGDESNYATDLSLLERMGDSRYRNQAWLDFLDQYTRLFFSWFRSWGVDPVIMEDVLQETMIRILGDLESFEHQRSGSFRAWMRTLARNSWSQFVSDSERQLARSKPDTDVFERIEKLSSKIAQNHLMELFDAMATREILDMAHSHVRRQVDAETWETYSLVTLQYRSAHEVMESLKIDATTLYNRIYRVRRMIREEMKKLNGPAFEKPDAR